MQYKLDCAIRGDESAMNALHRWVWSAASMDTGGMGRQATGVREEEKGKERKK